MIDLIARNMLEQRQALKTTVLFRKGGIWRMNEVRQLVQGLKTEVSTHPKHPESLIILGHYTEEQVHQCITDRSTYTLSQLTGLRHEQLPFTPGFI